MYKEESKLKLFVAYITIEMPDGREQYSTELIPEYSKDEIIKNVANSFLDKKSPPEYSIDVNEVKFPGYKITIEKE